MRLSMLDRDSHPLILWLTQRLGDRMVKALVTALDTTVQKEVPQAATPGAMPAAQLWQQTEADLRMKRNAPVVAPPAISEEGLLESIGVRATATSYELEFNWREGSARLPMDGTYLRQLLRILHRHYTKSGWVTDGVWPEWFADNAHRTVLDSNQVN